MHPQVCLVQLRRFLGRNDLSEDALHTGGDPPPRNSTSSTNGGGTMDYAGMDAFFPAVYSRFQQRTKDA